MTSNSFNFPANLAIQPSSDPSHHHSLEESTDEGLVDGHTAIVDFDTQKRAIEEYGIAGRIWEAAYALNAYIDPELGLEFDPPCPITTPSIKLWKTGDDEKKRHSSRRIILELGSGTGYNGIRIAEALEKRIGIESATVILTDLPEVVPLLESMLARHERSSSSQDQQKIVPILIRPLSWGTMEHVRAIANEVRLSSSSENEDLNDLSIVCSDLVYFPELLAPLLRSLIHITSIAPSSKIIISYKIRSLSKETPFWCAFGVWFSFEPVLSRRTSHTDTPSSNEESLNPKPVNQQWSRFGSANPSFDTCFIFIAVRRPETLDWALPDSDVDLLRGTGLPRQVDDTFETLLFMGLEQ